MTLLITTDKGDNMLSKIKEFQRQAKALGRNAYSIEEFKLWLDAQTKTAEKPVETDLELAEVALAKATAAYLDALLQDFGKDVVLDEVEEALDELTSETFGLWAKEKFPLDI
jgi:hypothetical protein